MNGVMMRRVMQLLTGLVLMGFAIAFLVRSALGASPWDVLTQGISHHVSLTFGTITVITSGLVLLLWIPLRQKPGVGTILNSLIIGPSADLGFVFVPEVDAFWLRIAFISIGIVIAGLATGLYIGARFGPGPRDGLMTGLHRITGRPIWQVRASIELVVVILGWSLGGIVGIGTVAFAVLIGPVCQYFMRVFYIPLASDEETSIVASVSPDQAAPVLVD